ncbi:MAG: hypothetical protein LBU73_01175 [Helicobacteraceae bacterium]|jgi:cell division transport system permease protein|nr:hypothetical protein [Helicobacteraceae bacterium]
MKTLKNHISLTFAIGALLATIQAFISFAEIVGNYERDLGDEYAIVLVAKSKIELDHIAAFVPQAIMLETIDASEIVEEIKETVGEGNLAYLKSNLPKFYRLKLTHYPSINERADIERSIAQIPAISRVETFAKTQDRLYRLLILIKMALLILAVLVFCLATLLIIRQMQVWRYEHRNRISVMAIFGAPLWFRSAVLYRLAIVDSILATAIVSALFYYLSNEIFFQAALDEIGLAGSSFNALKSTLILLAVAVAISMTSATYANFRAEEVD